MMRALGLEVDPEAFDLSYRTGTLSERSGMPVLVGIGDDVAGPFVGLFFDAPSTPEQLAGPPDLTPAHGHPCDNFRIVMKGELWVGQERYHHGEFRLQRTGRPYGSDGDAPHEEGNWRIIFFADRRGHMVRPTNPELRKQMMGPEATERLKGYMGDILPEILDDDDRGVEGLVTTVDKTFSKQAHVDASFDEADSWVAIGEGGRIAVTLMGHHEVGPIVILQRTPAGGLATPALTIGSDLFRCVIAGSHTRGGEQVVMGDTRFQAAGVPWEEVVAGPDGLDEVIIVGDRRGMPPKASGPSAWADELTSIVDGLRAGLAPLVDA
jgi:hypothetical protein